MFAGIFASVPVTNSHLPRLEAHPTRALYPHTMLGLFVIFKATLSLECLGARRTLEKLHWLPAGGDVSLHCQKSGEAFLAYKALEESTCVRMFSSV